MVSTVIRRIGAALLIALTLSGCWDRRETNEQAFIMAMAVDKQEERFILTIQMLRPHMMAGEGDLEADVWVAHGTGRSLPDALQSLDSTSQRFLNKTHTRLVLLGEDLARSGLRPTIEFLSRSGRISPTVWLAVTNGFAANVLDQKPGIGRFPALENLGSQGDVRNHIGWIPATRLHEALRTLASEGRSLLLPRIQLTQTSPGEMRGARDIQMRGSAVFRGDRMVSWAAEDAIRGVLFANNLVRQTIVTVDCPDQKTPGTASVRIVSSDAQITARRLGADIAVEMTGQVLSYQCQMDLFTPEGHDRLARVLADEVSGEIRAALSQGAEFGADVIGLGQRMHRTRPDEWRTVRVNWAERLPQYKVEVTVRSKVERLGMRKNPVR